MQLHFLSGIPRSGSTVLAAILNQNPETQVSTTSSLIHILNGLAETWSNAHLLNKEDPKREQLQHVMRAVIKARYEGQKPVIIDKSRGWPIPQIMDAMSLVNQEPIKIIATVRDITDCAASFVRVANPRNLDEFIYGGQLMDHLKHAYITLQTGYNYKPEVFHFVEYEDLLTDPKAELEKIHEFLGLAPFEYDFANIDGSTVAEDDEEMHGYAGMHKVAKKLGRQHYQNAKDLLKHHYNKFCHPAFWRGEVVPKGYEMDPLDVQVTAGRLGNFEEGWRIAQQLEKERPWDHRAAYNRGWYYLRDGKIKEGYALLERGRIEECWGNRPADTPAPLWDGKSKGTILLRLEAGLGDQIHQVRYAKDLAALGNKVVVACSGQLASLFRDIEGVSAVVQMDALYGVYHDFWIPAMSMPFYLGYDLEDLSGAQYIPRPEVPKGKKLRIGLRWSGNPMFEHEQHRVFPVEPFFESVAGIDAEFISLQRDEGAELRPDWVKEVDLSTWEATRHAVASCDLVITSCTSVSHLSAAMGVETWVVQAVMPYYLYALPGEKTPYYDAMVMIRQKEYGDWQNCFDEIKERLEARFSEAEAA